MNGLVKLSLGANSIQHVDLSKYRWSVHDIFSHKKNCPQLVSSQVAFGNVEPEPKPFR